MGRIGYYVREFENQLDGETLYRASLAKYSTLDERQMIAAAARNQRIDEQTMTQGMYALSDAILNFVMNGHSVTLDGLGCFTLSCKTGIWDDKKKKWKSAGRTNMDDVSPADIRGVYVRFYPCTELREKMAMTEFYDITATKFMADAGGYEIDNGKPKKPVVQP